MTQVSGARTRRWWQIPVWMLLIVPVVCAPFFLLVRYLGRMSPETLGHVEYEWVANPQKARFWPQDGSWTSPGDPLLKIASVNFLNQPYGGYRGVSNWLYTDGKIHTWVHMGNDRWSDERSASAAGVAQLPALVAKLPPSDPTAGAKERVQVAFQNNGVWVVRAYAGANVPQEVTDLARAVGIWEK